MTGMWFLILIAAAAYVAGAIATAAWLLIANRHDLNRDDVQADMLFAGLWPLGYGLMVYDLIDTWRRLRRQRPQA